MGHLRQLGSFEDMHGTYCKYHWLQWILQLCYKMVALVETVDFGQKFLPTGPVVEILILSAKGTCHSLSSASGDCMCLS